MRSEFQAHASDHPWANPVHAPPPPVSDYLQDSGLQSQELRQKMWEEAVLERSTFLHMLLAPCL